MIPARFLVRKRHGDSFLKTGVIADIETARQSPMFRQEGLRDFMRTRLADALGHVGANPTDDIRDTHSLEIVVSEGRVVDRQALIGGVR